MAQVVHEQTFLLETPGVAVKSGTAGNEDTVGMEDVLARGQKLLEDVGREFKHIDIQPQDPGFVRQGLKEQMIAAFGQGHATLDLNPARPAMLTGGNAKAEILPPEPHAREGPA